MNYRRDVNEKAIDFIEGIRYSGKLTKIMQEGRMTRSSIIQPGTNTLTVKPTG